MIVGFIFKGIIFWAVLISQTDRSVHLNETMASEIQELSFVDVASPEIFAFSVLKGQPVIARGVIPERYLEIEAGSVVQGSARQGTCLVGEQLAQRLDIQLVRIGSAGAKAMSVVRGDTDAYLHAGGQWEWDSAAPAGVMWAAGMHASRVNGSPLIYNRPNPYLPDLLMCRPELADVLLGAIRLAG